MPCHLLVVNNAPRCGMHATCHGGILAQSSRRRWEVTKFCAMYRTWNMSVMMTTIDGGGIGRNRGSGGRVEDGVILTSRQTLELDLTSQDGRMGFISTSCFFNIFFLLRMMKGMAVYRL